MQSKVIKQQGQEAVERQGQLENELDEIDRALNQEAAKLAPDPKTVGTLMKRKAQLEQEAEFLARRLTALEAQHGEAVQQEARARLEEIGREHAALRSQAEGLMTSIAEACAVIVRAVGELRPLVELHSRLDHEAEFLALRYDLPVRGLQPLPLPARDFLRPAEQARDALARPVGAAEWQRKLYTLKAEREAARQKARAAEQNRGVSVTVVGKGRDWTQVLNEREEAKAKELRAAIGQGPRVLPQLPRSRQE
jgi:hypothetical protein